MAGRVMFCPSSMAIPDLSRSKEVVVVGPNIRLVLEGQQRPILLGSYGATSKTCQNYYPQVSGITNVNLVGYFGKHEGQEDVSGYRAFETQVDW